METISLQKENSLPPPPAIAAAPRQHIVRRRRVTAFLIVILAECGLLWLLLLRDPYFVRRHFSASVSSHTPPLDNRMFLSDPALGSLLPSEGAGTSVQHLTMPHTKGFLLVPVGECASCLATDLKAWQRECRSRNLQMILLTSATPQKARAFRTKLGLSSLIALDPYEKLMKGLNVV